MVNYKFESVQMLKSSVSELEVEQKLADIRMQLSEASLEMKSVDAVLDSVTLALDVIHNYKGEDDQIIGLINYGGAMERLLGVAEKDITVSASEEGLGDVLKTIWEKIKQFIAWLIQKIKDFGVWIGKKLGLVKDDVKDLKKDLDDISKDVTKKTEKSLEKVFENAKVSIDKRGVEMMNEMLKEVNEKFGTNYKASEVKASLEGHADDYTVDKQNQIVRFYHKNDLIAICEDLDTIATEEKVPFDVEILVRWLNQAEQSGNAREYAAARSAPPPKSSPEEMRKNFEEQRNKVERKLKFLKIDPDGYSIVFGRTPPQIQGTLYNMGYHTADDCLDVLHRLDKFITDMSTCEAYSRKLASELERINNTIKGKNTNSSDAKIVRMALNQANTIIRVTSDARNKVASTIRLTTDVLRDAVGKAKRLKDAW